MADYKTMDYDQVSERFDRISDPRARSYLFIKYRDNPKTPEGTKKALEEYRKKNSDKFKGYRNNDVSELEDIVKKSRVYGGKRTASGGYKRGAGKARIVGFARVPVYESYYKPR